MSNTPQVERSAQQAPCDQAQIDTFRTATGTQHCTFPPSFFTLLRQAEYDVMDTLKPNWQYLLHADQEYEYFEPFEPGAPIEVKARLADLKERKGNKVFTRFIKLQSEIFCGDKKVALSTTSFVIREPVEANDEVE